MPALPAVLGVVLLVEVQDELLGLEAKPLVEQHGRVGSGDVERDIFPHACLKREGQSISERW